MKMAHYSNKNYSYDEMMVHVPLCTHKNINKILIVGNISDYFKEELLKHECKNITYSDTLNIEGQFDIILHNNATLNELDMANVEKCIEPEAGIFVTKSSFISKNIEISKKELKIIGKNFWICIPYSFGHNTLIFASKKYHPQAQIILQVSDLLENCNYYNSEIHNCVFVHPNYITKEITGIAKR
jgi:spermidine synthase